MENEIKDCICCWYDLLGFGNAFSESKWNLKDTKCTVNFDRIKQIKDRFYGVSTLGCGKSLILNDGVVNSMDIKKIGGESLFELRKFLGGLINDFYKINQMEKKQGLPGIRGVITCGQRYNYINFDYTYIGASGEIMTYVPLEFQMNTAFSKANIIEESGSRKKISGAYLYIDKEVLQKIQALIERRDMVMHIEEYEDDREYVFNICVPDNKEWLKMRFSSDIIHYEEKGINTDLYKLIGFKDVIFAEEELDLTNL